ncbi:MAG TPA: phosphoribosylaminoimidazolesuccinocarboxamide synthase [bacterium]
MSRLVLQTALPGYPPPRRGKVRDVYDIGEHFLIVATDRISAFDVVLPNGIPGKGRVLTQISIHWFRQVADIVENHLVATEVDDFPAPLRAHRDVLEGRSMLVKKAAVLPVECIVRGYLSGSGWKEYKASGTVCGIRLPAGLTESARLETPIFTPSTKAEAGHDVNISFEELSRIVGDDLACMLRDTALAVYGRGRELAGKRGIIIADTKMEFGIFDKRLILIDELMTPDSSRFWSAATWQPGRGQDSWDKQIVRDYLLTLDWDQTYPGPVLPDAIVAKAAARYEEIYRILTQ